MTDKPNKKLSVLIIGCGNIAGGFDLSNNNRQPLTHAAAYYQDERFDLKACMDPDNEKLTSFKDKWGVKNLYSSLDQIKDSFDLFDVISFCSPTLAHKESLDFAIDLKPKLVFCEKPITEDLKITESLINKYSKNKILLAINYTRRWMNDVQEFYEDLNSGKWGNVRSVVGHYNKGLLNNGSHLIDFLHFLLGPLSINYTGNPIVDYSENDPTIPVVLESKNSVLIYLNAMDSNDYSFFEINFYMEKGIVQLSDGGLSWNIREVKNSKEFKGYKSLSEVKKTESEYGLAMRNALDNIYNAITENEKLKSDGSTAIETHRTCSLIREKSISVNSKKVHE